LTVERASNWDKGESLGKKEKGKRNSTHQGEVRIGLKEKEGSLQGRAPCVKIRWV